MRAMLIGLVVAVGCGGAADRGPAWPRSAGTVAAREGVEDGGESLEPRESVHPIAALEAASDELPIIEVVDVVPEPTVGTPPVVPAVTAPTGETIEIQVEEITISSDDIVVTPP